jgi:hypothetical protein
MPLNATVNARRASRERSHDSPALNRTPYGLRSLVLIRNEIGQNAHRATLTQINASPWCIHNECFSQSAWPFDWQENHEL